MKTYLYKTILSLTIMLFLINGSFAQTTYKVVCDKKDNTVKVVEATNKSANYIPIKSGFPFRQIAEQWISENYTTRTCNPGDRTTPNNKTQKNITQTNNQQATPSKAYPPSQTPSKQSPPAINYRNSSVILHGKFSNLGEAFLLTESMMPGIEVGFEQLFGSRGYFGTGISANFFFSDMDGRQGVDAETIYSFRFPAFGGYRIQKRMFVAMFEAGGAFNTGLRGTELNLESFGRTAEDLSINFMTRVKLGFPGIMFEIGYDSWLTNVFVDDSFKMSAIRMGLRFSF